MTTQNVATNQATNAPTIKAILATPIEALQATPLEQLDVLHKTLKASTDKKALRKADLIAGIMKGLQKALSVVAPPAPLVENSVKAPAKRKAPVKKAVKDVKEAIADVKEEEAPKAPSKKAPAKKAPSKAPAKAEEKAEAPKAPKSLKRVKKPTVNLEAMTPAELIEHVKQLEASTETFPASIAGEKTSYDRVEFDTIVDIQKQLIKSPMKLYLFADEKIDDKLTQFIVLFVNEEILVLLDRNRQVNSTVTIKQSQLEADTITFDKAKFKYSFYTRK